MRPPAIERATNLPLDTEVHRPLLRAAASGHRVLRRIVHAAVGLAIAALLISTWHFERFEVSSGSMAMALLGPHADVVCRDCGLPFVCGVEDASSLGRPAICPNCGGADQWIDAAGCVRGDRVLVDRSAWMFRYARRWELAAFRTPDRAGEIGVKRIVGLPGESVAIRDGDVFIDGARLRKDLAEQRALEILVHDQNYLPARATTRAARWQSERTDSHWRPSGRGFAWSTHGRADATSREVDWLVYGHTRRAAAGEPGVAMPVFDTCGYNQTSPVTDAQPVFDLRLSCLLTLRSAGAVAFRARYGDESFVSTIDLVDRSIALHRGGSLVAQCQLPDDMRAGAAYRIDVSVVDRQFLLAIDGTPAVTHAFDVADPRPSVEPLAIGGVGVDIEVADLRVYRDVYYTLPPGSTWASGPSSNVQLGPGELFVLGDNSRLSDDSRTWTSGSPLDANLLIGKPLLRYGRATGSLRRGPTDRVGEPARIGYIR